MCGTRNLKLVGGQGPGHRGNNFCVCGPNVDFIQLLHGSKRCSGYQGSVTFSAFGRAMEAAKLPAF